MSREEKEREAVAATARRKIEKLRGIAEARASREATAAAYAKAWHDLATCANDLTDGENGGAFVALLDAFLEAWLSARGRAAK